MRRKLFLKLDVYTIGQEIDCYYFLVSNLKSLIQVNQIIVTGVTLNPLMRFSRAPIKFPKKKTIIAIFNKVPSFFTVRHIF